MPISDHRVRRPLRRNLVYEDPTGVLLPDGVGTQSYASRLTLPGKIEAIKSVDQRFSDYLVAWFVVDQLADLGSCTMPEEARSLRLAVLIDADNAPPRITPGLFEEIAKLGEASVRRIYGDFSGTKLKSWAEQLSRHAIIPHQNFANTPGKNASDIALVIDAMDLLHSGRFDGFCLVSSDSDFTRLAARIREQGLNVYGFGEHKTPDSFRQACKRFFYTENLLLPPSEPKPPESPEPPKAIARTKAQKPEPKPARVKEPVSAALELLRKAVTQLADEDGWARLDTIGTYVLTLAPDFDTRTYGYSKLSDLVAKSGQFEVRRDQANFILVRLVAALASTPDDGDEIPV